MDDSSIAITKHTENIREQWSSNIDFLLSCLGYAVGLGNVWRFPTKAYANGGGAFFIPYWLMLFFVGMPIFFLELALGQFTSAGQTTCWDFCPVAQGLGFGMTIVALLTACYYNMIISWSLYFMVASMQSELPWLHCEKEWSTERCIENVDIVSFRDCSVKYNGIPCQDGNCLPGKPCRAGNGVCKRKDNISKLVIWDPEAAATAKCGLTFPAKEYFENVVLSSGEGDLENIGPIKGKLLLCLLVSWIFVCACLAGGIKTSGKVVYVTATAPYIILFVLFIRGIMLEGSIEGIEYYLSPNVTKLADATVWKDAALQIFFSLSTSYGGLIALASYNKFHNDIHRDTLIVTIGNCMTSVFAGFVVFSFLDFLAKTQGMNIDQLSEGGPDLVFGVYPFCLTKMPGSMGWSVFFFCMLIMLGIDSQFVLTETVITAIVDTFPDYFRKKKYPVVIAVCVILFLMGIPLTTPGGDEVLDLMDSYAGGWNVLIIAFCECIAIRRYGLDRFIMDVELMIGSKFSRLGHLWWKYNWGIMTPLNLLFVTLFALFGESTKKNKRWIFDHLIGFLGITLSTSILIPAFFFIYHVVNAEGSSFMEKLSNATKPTRYWGPAIIKDRKKVCLYIDDFIVDPEHPEGYHDPAKKSHSATITYQPSRLQSVIQKYIQKDNRSELESEL